MSRTSRLSFAVEASDELAARMTGLSVSFVPRATGPAEHCARVRTTVVEEEGLHSAGELGEEDPDPIGTALDDEDHTYRSMDAYAADGFWVVLEGLMPGVYSSWREFYRALGSHSRGQDRSWMFRRTRRQAEASYKKALRNGEVIKYLQPPSSTPRERLQSSAVSSSMAATSAAAGETFNRTSEASPRNSSAQPAGVSGPPPAPSRAVSVTPTTNVPSPPTPSAVRRPTATTNVPSALPMFTATHAANVPLRQRPRSKYAAYVVYVGRERGVFKNWEEVEPLVMNYSGTDQSSVPCIIFPLPARLHACTNTSIALSMPRASTGKPRGRPSWAKGTKLTFLVNHMDDYRKVEGDKNKVAKFYGSLTKLFILKYGYDKAINGDLDEDVPDPDISLLEEVSDHKGETEEEANARLTVRQQVHKRISQWYQYYSKKLGNLPSPEYASNDETFVELVKGIVKRPRRENVLHVFAEMYWSDLIDKEYSNEWAKCVALAGEAGTGLPKELEVHNRVVKRVFDQQSASIRESVQQIVDTRHEKAMAKYEKDFIERPDSMEQKEWALNSAFAILQPMVDMVSS
ncbi:hypothetical protein FA95DRAFT_1613084 [Auriscalpium vulgare]|uniref:Uncharacterized protein n=1 Tax=Auriscalpium vulgare TaxID=40419 RepID=A0ACB8R5B9_9AGAM|nr:hypothetical protein FA95DRAFT_1613084 [Auriscalpium vulgare]